MSFYNQKEFFELLQRIRDEGGCISKEYIKWGHDIYAKFNQQMPHLWRTIMSRRYLLPNKIQPDYASQEACDYLFLDFITSYSLRLLPDSDQVSHVSYINAMRALEFGRPTYYIERDLAEALLRTDVPLDIQADDIHWIYPQFRLYLPKDLIGVTRNGQTSSSMFIDVCRVDKDKFYSMPMVMRKEMAAIGAKFFPEHEVPMDGFLMNSTLDFDSPEGSVGYALATPWGGRQMADIINVGNTYSLSSYMASDDLDRKYQSQLICFAINVMLMLGALPPEEQTKLKLDTKVIRKPRLEGKHAIAGLYPAKLIGVEQAPKQTRLQLKSEPTGRHLSAHWRRGHWRRQAYGPKSGLRRFQWIAPCHVGQE